MKLIHLFIKSAETGLEKQRSDGAMSAGHNGPHNDPETPVRNTSHWLIFFLKAFELSEEPKFKKAASSCLSYLLMKESRPGDATFYHRKNPQKDFSNGIIGQAWTIEALIYASRKFNNPEILKLAEDVFNLHPYDPSVQAWKVVNPDGTIRDYDRTFNHQLWFASIGCELIKQGVTSVQDSVDHFIQNIHKNIEFYPDGVIKHYPYAYTFPPSLRKSAGRLNNRLKSLFNPFDSNYSHSVGYHAFNTYALGVIYRYDPDLPFFKNGLFRTSLDAIGNDRFQKCLPEAKFGYPYNPPGIEIAVSLQAGTQLSKNEIEKLQKKWLNKQFEMNFDFNNFTMTRNTPDPLTNQARMYELYRLDNFNVNIRKP